MKHSIRMRLGLCLLVAMAFIPRMQRATANEQEQRTPQAGATESESRAKQGGAEPTFGPVIERIIIHPGGSTMMARGIAPNGIRLDVNASGQVVFDKKVTTFEALEEILKVRLADNKDLPVFISSDATTPYDAILAVLAVVRGCGVTNVQFRKLLVTDAARPEESKFQIQIRQEAIPSPSEPRDGTGMPMGRQTVPADKRITPVDGVLLELNQPGSITVVISLGGDDGLMPGDILSILRKGQGVGRLKVSKVERDRSTATILAVVDVKALEAGDQVTNQKLPEGPPVPNRQPPQNADAQRKQEVPTGVLSGRFVYDGEPPVAKDLYPSFAELRIDKPQQPGPDGRLSGVEAIYREYLKHNIRPATTDQSLRVDKGKGVADVLVWVVSKDIPWSPPLEGQAPVTIKVNEASISPRTAVVIAGQPVLFENRDPMAQRVYARFTQALNPQYHVLLKPKATHRVSFPVPEPFPARISLPHCPWATGLLFVHGNPYVAISKEDGTFRIPNLPPGKWGFQAWHERSGYISNWPKGRFTQKIISGDNSLGDIRMHPDRFRASYDDDSTLLRTVTIRLIENDRTLTDHTVQSDSQGHVNFVTGGEIGADKQHVKTNFGTRIIGTVKSLSNRQYDLDLTVSQGLPFETNDADTQVLRTETLGIRTRITIGTESSIECGGGRYCVIRLD